MAKQANIEVIINSDEAKRRFEELQGSLKDIKSLRDKAFANGDVGAFKVYDKELKDVNKEMRQFKANTNEVEIALKNINKISPNDLESAFKKARQEMKATARDADAFTAKKANFEKLRDELDKVNGSIKSQGSFFSKASDNFNKYFGMAGAAIASFTGVFLGLKQTITDFNEYQGKVANLSALTGLKGDDLDWISQKAKDLSTTITEEGVRITQGADVIVDAFTKMGSAKPELLKDKEALAETTKQAIILSEAAKMDLAPAVDGLALTMNQFGAGAKEAGRYVNVLAAGSKEGAAEIPDISAAIVKFGAAAKTANVSVEESVGLIEALSEKGIKGEIAGTGLKTMLVKMMTGADEFNPKVVGMQQSLENLSKANLSATQLTKMFGLENYTVVKSLIDSKDRVNELTKAVTGTNVAYEQANINTDTNAAKLEQQKNKIKLISLELGEKLAPVMASSLGLFTKFMQVLIASIGFYAKHSYAINSTVAVIGAYIAATKLQTYWTALTTKTTVDGIAVSKLQLIQQKLHVFWTTASTAATQLFSAAQLLFTGRLKEAKIAFQAFNTTMKTSPWGIALAAALALGLALYALIRRKKELVSVTSNMIGQYQEEKAESDKLFESIKKTKEGTEGRAKAIQMVNDKYGAYVGYLLDEKAGLQDIAKYQDIVNESLMKNIAIKSQQQEIDRVLKESQDAIKTEFDDIISDIESSQGSVVAGQAGVDLNQVITNIIRDPNAASGEIAFRNKYGINPGEMVDKMNQVRDAVRKRNAEMDRINLFFDSYIKNLRGNIVPSGGGTPPPGGGTPPPGSGGGGGSSNSTDWSLESDKDHLDKLKELKKKFINGEIKTQDEFDEEVLQLEIETLQNRILLNKDTAEVLTKINAQLIDKQLEDHKNGIKRKEDAEKKLQDLTKQDIEKIQQDNEKALADLKIRNNEEFASITSLEEAKKILKDTMSQEELDKITNLYEAKQEIRKQYDKKEQDLAIKQMADLIKIFEDISKSGFVNDINMGELLLTPEQKAELEKNLKALREEFAKLKADANVGEKPDEKDKKPKNNDLKIASVDIFGFSPDDWETLFKNLESGKVGVGEIAMAANALVDVWKSYDQILKQQEEKELAKYVKAQDKKKASLNKRLAQGRVSEESYAASVQAMDLDTERKKAKIARDQAVRERNIALMSAIVNTSAAMVQAFVKPGGALGIALAATIGIAGGIQIGKIMSTALPELPGAESGGSIMDVIRSQDGKKFRAKNDPNKRGFVSQPTIITGENGTEYVLPKEALQNPHIANLIGFIEQARLNGSLANINFPAVSQVAGYESGGFAKSSRQSITEIKSETSVINNQTAQLTEVTEVMKQVRDVLSKPIKAETYLRGKGGIYEAQKEDLLLKKNATL